MQDQFITTVLEINQVSSFSGEVPALVVMTDRQRQQDIFSIITQLPEGSGLVLRDYDHPQREEYSEHIAHACREKKLHMVFSLRVRDAAAIVPPPVGWGGIHLPEAALPSLALLRKKYPEITISVAVHSLSNAKWAEKQGASWVFFSPIFATQSHPQASPVGIDALCEVVNAVSIPVYALGGINEKTIAGLKKTGIAGTAFVGAFEATT